MSSFNKYITQYDHSWFIDFIVQNGTLVQYRKNEIFCAAGKPCRAFGFVRKGAFISSAPDNQGEKHTVCFAFENSFVGEYAALRLKLPVVADITALCDSEVYVITAKTLNQFISHNSETRDRFLRIVEIVFFEMYQRFVFSYTRTVEEHYTEILNRCLDIFRFTTVKDLASYLRVTPETLSRIRRRLKEK